MKRLYKMAKRAATAALAALMLLMCCAPALAEAFSAIVVSGKMTVYADAALTQELTTLDKNTVVRVTGYSSTIARISYNGETGYAKISDMKSVDSVAEKAVLNAEALIYAQPLEDSLSVKMPAGTPLYVLAESGEWSMVERSGTVGYVKSIYLKKTGSEWVTPAPTLAPGATPKVDGQSGITVRTYSAVTVEDVKIYKSASESGKLLGTLKAGVQLTVLATSSNGWAYIQALGKKGFCKLSGLKEIVEGATPTPAPGETTSPTQAPAKQGTVTVDRLTVYSQASTSSKKLGTLKKGQTVNVLNWNSQWAYIELNGQYGFCAVAGLTQAEAEATPVPSPTPALEGAKPGTVTADSLVVYQTASTSGKKLGTLKKGQVVNVIKTQNGWAYIELNGSYGFCRAKGLSISKKQDGVPAGYKKADIKATVVTSDARAYALPNIDSESLELKLGTEVQVRGYDSAWACVEQNGGYAFVALKALSKKEYTPIDGDGQQLQTLLKALLTGGYFDSEPSTVYNAAATTAIKRFQKTCGLEETGVADQTMLRIVYSGYAPVSSLLYSTLSSGDSGDSVSRVQARLYTLKYLSKTNSLNGSYDSTTASAVKLFQKANGITVTGTADSNTIKAMYTLDAKKLPSGEKAADAGSSGSGGGSSSTYLSSVPRGLESTTSTYSSSMSNAEKLEHAIYLAQGKMGKPYVYGATGPDKFDCSGLTTWAFKAIGVSLPRTAYSQGYDNDYTKISGSGSLKRGDLVFFNTVSDSDSCDHVGIYLGEGYFIHASSGAHKVVVSNLNSGYYGRVFSWGRRILK